MSDFDAYSVGLLKEIGALKFENEKLKELNAKLSAELSASKSKIKELSLAIKNYRPNA